MPNERAWPLQGTHPGTRSAEGSPMNRWRSIALAAASAAAGPAWAQDASHYTYVKMSLAVPWALYFVFLACVLIPFVVMIVLAWRRGPRGDADASKHDGASTDTTAGESR